MKSSSLIIGEVVGIEAGVAVRLAVGLRAAPVGGGEALYLTVSASEPGALQMAARNWEEVKQEGTPSYQPQSN